MESRGLRMGLGLALVLSGSCGPGNSSRTASASAPAERISSSAVLAQLPEGERKQQFIIDCTNCHQFGIAHAYPGGRVRTREEWEGIVVRMAGFAGAHTSFPIMSAGLRADSLAVWLAGYLTASPVRNAPSDRRASRQAERSSVREYLFPVPNDLPHDVAVDSSGRVVVTGMFSAAMYVLDTASGSFAKIPIPVERANPRAIEVAPNGDWWIVLGGPHRMARHRPGTGQWDTYPIGMYAHSVALGAGRAWFNGHFTRDPEQVGYVDMASGERQLFDAPMHPTKAAVPGGPIPYEIRVDGRGRLWMSELQGHRILSFTPETRSWRTYQLPAAISAPRRFDIGDDNTLWIPVYAGNALVRLDPETGLTRTFSLPRADAVPYVAKFHRGTVWVGTNASDEVYAFDTRTSSWRMYPLPTAGAVIRHLVVDPRNGDVWLAYGASPGISARIARLRP
jgi:streptogramin lyase